MQEEKAFNIEKMEVNDWVEYKCKTGQTLFIKVAEGHKWPAESKSSRIIGQCKSFSSVGTQTDDKDCVNGCTSMYINNNTSSNANQASKEHDNGHSGHQDCVQSCSSVVSRQTSSTDNTSYASDLSAVLRVLEEEFDPPVDESEVSSNSLNVTENIQNKSKYTLNGNEKKFVDVRHGIPGSYNMETGNELSEKTEPLMVKETTGTSHIDNNQVEQTTNAKDRGNRELEQVPETALTSEEEDFQCMNCKEVFKCKTAYNEHLLTHRRHKCPQCGKEYSYKFYLKYHLITHKQRNIMQAISCTFCDRKFSNQDEHDVHIKGHVGEKPYVCTLCDRSFKSRNNFKAHQQRIHTERRKYQCSYCNQAFQRSDHLHRHLRKHTGEKPHRCVFCGKAFGRKDNLTCHLRIHMK